MAGEDLDAQSLLTRAREETGLDDWGDDSFEHRFGLAVDHINSIPMDAAGRQAARDNINWLLTDRLKFFNDFKLYPLAEEVIDHPMFATGEPRSGTTLMHALMSVDPDARALRVLGGHAPLTTAGNSRRQRPPHRAVLMPNGEEINTKMWKWLHCHPVQRYAW